ncbi:MAG: HisA/HisF-related TIM barrel protein, partial [Candidatus Syntropharchaeia archaeon]
IIPVLDILGGKVVHAVGGERRKYLPIHKFSSIVRSSDPFELLEILDPREVYVADLDRLMGRGENLQIKSISKRWKCMLDWGVRNEEDLKKAREIADIVIIGTETGSMNLIRNAGGGISVSCDMLGGSILSSDESLRIPLPDLVKILNDFEIRDLILLDISRVGTKSGIDIDLIEEVVKTSVHPVLIGGGIRGMEDIEILKKIGVDGVLVGTAIHDRSIPLEMVK